MEYATAMRCAILAQEIYRDFANVKFSGFPDSTPELIQLETTDTQCAIIPDDVDNRLYIIFRGTENRLDWKTNVEFSRDLFEIRRVEEAAARTTPPTGAPSTRDILPVTGTDLASNAPRAQMHRGFVNAYMSVQRNVHRYVQSMLPANLTFVGHSLGGALATLGAIDFQLTYQGRYAIDIYTFGSPKVGNPAFRDLFNEHVPNHYRFVHGLDIVPELPRFWQGYYHVNQLYRLGSRLTLQFFSRRVSDHYMTSYIAALQSMIDNA